MIGKQGTTRDGQKVKIIDVQGAYYVVLSETGAQFTVHNIEFTPNDATPEQIKAIQQATRDWPSTNLSVAVVRDDRSRDLNLAVRSIPGVPAA